MEDRIKAAVETSDLWMKAAEDTKKGGSYNVSLYSLEMSLEIIMKAMLMKFSIDPPKTHDVGNLLKRVLIDAKKERIDKKEVENAVDLFYTLLGLRNESGYMYDSRTSNARLGELLEMYFEPTRRYVNFFKKTLDSL